MKTWIRKSHRQVGLIALLAIIGVAGTGLALVHADRWGGYDFRHLANGQQVTLAGGTQGLYRSVDGGTTWEEVTMPVPTQQVTALAEANGHFAVAFRDMGMWQSEDGYVWEKGNAPDHETILAISGHPPAWTLLTDQALYEGTRRTPYPPSLSRRFHDWHTGWAWGAIGVRVVEVTAIALIGLSLSGLWLAWPLRRRGRFGVITLAQPAKRP